MLPNSLKNKAKLEIAKLDHYRCRNYFCSNPYFMPSVHRIVRASHGGEYRPKNGIVLCANCHAKAEGKNNPKDKNGRRITGNQFLLEILEYWAGKIEDRFNWARKYLRAKIDKKNIEVYKKL